MSLALCVYVYVCVGALVFFVCLCAFVCVKETLSAAAESRLAALPDLSYMLSQRIRFPIRAAEPMPPTAWKV